MNSAKFFAFAFAGALLLLGGCGPKYPNCDTDEHCAQKNEVCVNGLCKECRTDSTCNAADACGACIGNQCGRRANCCTSDADCPSGRCWNVAGKNYGECGSQCGAGKPCPAGQRCDAQGNCVPDDQCGQGRPCPDDQQCENGKCVAACEMQAIYFDYNESRIRSDQMDTLSSNATCAQARGKTVRIEGHCDERGTEEYNLALGESRAKEARSQMQSRGLSSSSMRYISYGEEKPVPGCSGNSEPCWKQNRRAEFHFE